MHKIFGKKSKSKDNLADYTQNSTQNDMPRPAETNSVPATNGNTKPKSPVVQRNEPPQQPPRPKLVFHCQQAHGSPTGIISGFTNVKELYQKIADCYDMPVSEILFCTLNTHKVDMSKLLGGQIGLEDFIFAHVKGRPKEMEITKSEDALGLTITDNGAGYAFIKRIKDSSIMDKSAELVNVGDHIEKIDGKSLVGCRHFEVAKMLKEIPKGTTFTIRVVEPMKSGFSFVEQKQNKKGSSSIGSGKQTLRLRSTGPATVEDVDDSSDLAIDKINGLLESFMGINDTELSQQIWEIGNKQDNPSDFAMAIDKSDIQDFGFADDFVFDLWGAISDAKSGRLNKAEMKEFSEQF